MYYHFHTIFIPFLNVLSNCIRIGRCIRPTAAVSTRTPQNINGGATSTMIPELVQTSNNVTPIAGFGLGPNQALSVPASGEASGLGLGPIPSASLADRSVAHLPGIGESLNIRGSAFFCTATFRFCG